MTDKRKDKLEVKFVIIASLHRCSGDCEKSMPSCCCRLQTIKHARRRCR